MRQKKKVSAILLLCLLLTILVGCNKDNAAEKKIGAAQETTKSEKIDLGEAYELVHDIQKTAEGGIRVGVSDKNGINSRVFESKDQGKSWKKTDELNESVNGEAGDYLEFSLGLNGEIFIKVVKEAASYEETLDKESQYFIKIGEKEAVALPVEVANIEESEVEHQNHRHESEHVGVNSLAKVEFASDGALLATDLGKTGYLIDSQTGKVKQTYQLLDQFESADDLFSDQQHVYFSSAMGFLVYDKASGKLKTDTDIEKVVSEKLEEALDKNMVVGTSINQDTNEGEVYFTTGLGAYSYDTETKKLTQHVDMTTSDLSLTMNYLRLLTVLDASSYLATVTSFEGSSPRDTLYLSTIYTGKEAAKQQATTETLRIWSLQEDHNLPLLIDMFEARHPNVKVESQIGMNRDSAQTITDAISSLNTKMLAEEGPDVILADGLPLDTYIKKGMLLNLDQFYQELSRSEDVFANVATTYQTKAGLYAIPQGFSYMTVTAKKGLTEQVKTGGTLLAYLNNKNVGVSVDSASSLTSLLYYSGLDEWFDGQSVNQGKLKEFFELTKQMLDKIEPYEPEKINFTQEAPSIYSGNFNFLVEDMPSEKEVEIALDSIGLPHNLYTLETLTQLGYENLPFNNQAKQFAPVGVLSISNSSQHQELAKKFLKFNLSKDGESFVGIPVNKQLLTNVFDDNATYRKAGTKPLTDEEMQQIIKSLEGLEAPVNLNGVISEAVVEQLEAHISKGEDLDTAVSNAAKKVELYLSE